MVADGELVRQQRRETCDDWKIDGTDTGTEREKGRDGSNRGYSETQIRIGGPIEAMRLDSSDEQ